MRAIYIDIDGTMTDKSNARWGKPRLDVINKVKELCKNNLVVIWTAGGYKYAKEFCSKYEINPTAILQKPDVIVDDNPNIRPKEIIKYLKPKELL